MIYMGYLVCIWAARQGNVFAVSSGAVHWDECCGHTPPRQGLYELICLDYCHSDRRHAHTFTVMYENRVCTFRVSLQSFLSSHWCHCLGFISSYFQRYVGRQTCICISSAPNSERMLSHKTSQWGEFYWCGDWRKYKPPNQSRSCSFSVILVFVRLFHGATSWVSTL